MKRHPGTHRTLLSLVWLSLVWLLSGCGNLTAGGFGEAEVQMSGDADSEPAPAPSAQATGPGPAAAPPAGVVLVGTLEGRVEVELSLFLQAVGGALHALTPAGPVQADRDLAGAEMDDVALQEVPAGAYDALRVEFESVTANVLGGLLIDGIPFVGPVSVELPAGGLIVTLPADIEVRERERTTLLLDLAADAWLAALDVLTGTVAASAFAAEVGVILP